MNPFPKPQAGAYRPLLVDLLTKIGNQRVADEFATRRVQFGIVRTFTGNVIRLPELQEDIITILDTLDNPIAGYYSYELEAGNVAVVLSAGAFVYEEDDKKAVAHVRAQLELDEQRVFKAGDLYFNS